MFCKEQSLMGKCGTAGIGCPILCHESRKKVDINVDINVDIWYNYLV